MRLDRRRVLALLTGIAGAALLPASAWAKKIAVKLEILPKLKRVGGFVTATVKGIEILFVRDAEDSVRAFTPYCSHKQFRLGYDAKAGQLTCSNHGSRFNLKGAPLKGPAKRPLDKVYRTKLDRAKQRVILDLD